MSEKKNIFLLIFDWIVNCYDNSFFEKVMKKIFGFFEKNIPGSGILGFFSRRDGSIWRKSRAAEIVRSPFSACRSFYRRNETKIENIKKQSGAYRFFKDAANISLRDFGVLALALAAGTAVGNTFFSMWSSAASVAAVIVFAVIGAYFCISGEAYSTLASDSAIIRFVKKTVSYYDNFERRYTEPIPLKNKKLFAAVSFAAGLVLFSRMPLGAMCGILGAAVVAAILYNTKIGVYLFVPLSAILPTMASVGIIAVTLVSFVLHMAFGRKAEYVSTPFQPCIAVFLGLAAYAALTGTAVLSSVKILMIYVIFTLAYVLIVNTVRTRSEWTALVVLLIFAAALVALYGIYQNYFLTMTTQSWVDEKMFTDIKKRVYSTLDNPNVLGEYFIMMMPIAFALLVRMRGNYQKAVYALCNMLMFVCLMYTWSRGAWLGVIIGIVFFVLLKDRRWLILCVAGILLMPSVLPASILSRLTSIGNMKDSSTAYRVAVWIGSARMLRDYWFCGIGLGPDAFLKIYPQYALGGADFALHSHNFYLQWIVDMGIVGILVYFWIIITGFKQICSIKEKDTVIKNVLLAMSGAILGYLFHGLAENLWYNYRMILVFWIFFGILQSGAAIAGGIDKEDIIS